MYPNLNSAQPGKGAPAAYPTGQQVPPPYSQMPAGSAPGQMPAGAVPGAVNVNVNYGWNPSVLPAGAVPHGMPPVPAGQQPPPAYSPTWNVLVKQNWERVQGFLRHVNVGPRGIYGTNHKHNIFVRNKKGDEWIQCAGNIIYLKNETLVLK